MRENTLFVMEMFRDGFTDKDYVYYSRQCKIEPKLTSNEFDKIMQECRDMTIEDFKYLLVMHQNE